MAQPARRTPRSNSGAGPGTSLANASPPTHRLDWLAAAQGPEGWILAGTTRQAWPARLARIELRFERALLTGPLCTVFAPPAPDGSRAFIALFEAPRPLAGQLLSLLITADLSLATTDVMARDQGEAGNTARAMLNAAPPSPESDSLRAALPVPLFTGLDTLPTIGTPLRVVLDALVRVPPEGIALAGALLDPMRAVRRIGLRQGTHYAELDRGLWAEVPRPDLAYLPEAGSSDPARHAPPRGFAAYARLPPKMTQPDCIEIETRAGVIGHLPLPAPTEGASLQVIEQFLNLPRQPLPRMEAVMAGCIGPIIRGLNRARLALSPTPRRLDFGTAPAGPRRSLIIPLHGRLDFMALQLALFSAQPDLATEIIYVLDDPRLSAEAERMAQSCLVRFGLAFTLLDLGANRGYAAANNAGLAIARGADICLLNADVFPGGGEGMSWLARLCAPLADADIGAVGALLLFEDGTVQHAGMEYRRIASLPPWPFPIHPHKGARPDPDMPTQQDVAAVTGACVAVRRAELLAIGGLDEDFVIADFEDAALCEALRARGLRIVLRSDVVLRHLERQTPGSEAPWRHGATLANASLFATRWNPDAKA